MLILINSSYVTVLVQCGKLIDICMHVLLFVRLCVCPACVRVSVSV